MNTQERCKPGSKQQVVRRRASCSACRAFDPSQGGGKCTLGYATKPLVRKGQGYGVFTLKQPDEPCPKPLTYGALFACKHKSYTEADNAEVSEVAVADATKTRGVRPPLSLD